MALKGKHATDADTLREERAQLISVFLLLMVYYALLGAFFAIVRWLAA
jgi:hypothetical protein